MSIKLQGKKYSHYYILYIFWIFFIDKHVLLCRKLLVIFKPVRWLMTKHNSLLGALENKLIF